MNVWAVIPVKPLNRAKSRLAAVLSPEMREQLAMAMLAHTLTVLRESTAVGGVLVISRDNRALVIAREHGARTVQESGTPELNAALERANQVIASWHARAALVLPADLPFLAVEDVVELERLGRYPQTAVLVPDQSEIGTNGILMRPPGLFPCLFGENSFQRHCEAAEAAGATVHVYRSERLMLDLDTPEDLVAYLDLCKKYREAPLIDVPADVLLPYAAVTHKEKP